MNIHKHVKTHWQITLYLLIFTVLFSVKIIAHPFPFFDWDESIYAQVGREMIQENSIVPLWQGRAWLDKPPLPPLFYGVVIATTPFAQPEVSSRLATLFLSTMALALVYLLYFKVTKDPWISTLTVIVTSLSSIFLQRAQVLNVDIFLLIGWLGYILWHKKYVTSLLFLSIAVMSKSLIGFYPVGILGIFYTYQFFRKNISGKVYAKHLLTLFSQVAILSIWYLLMWAIYGNDFLYKHIYESHFKRVSASIESHFGQRTFYIDLLFQEYGRYVFLAIVGFFMVFFQWMRKSISDKQVMYALYLLPWFFFLNLTKTKIFWYGHPYIPQFAFLILYPLRIFSHAKLIYKGLIIVLMTLLLNQYFITNTVLDDFYSSSEPHHAIAMYAKDRCTHLHVLLGRESREAFETLEGMDLLISTSRWWGNHPSMVYYFQKPLTFIYSIDELRLIAYDDTTPSCIVVENGDEEGQAHVAKYQKMFEVNPLSLYMISP